MPADALERRRLVVVLATIGINIIAVAALTLVPWSDWRTGLALNLFDNLLLGAFAWRYRDGFIARLLAFGLVVGLVELAADAWLVDYTRTLDYAVGGGPQLGRSPIWMPLAWQIVAVQFGYVGVRLYEWLGWRELALNGLLGAVNIPYYEEMAKRIHWWQYTAGRMISNTPYYIILGEFGIAVALGALAFRVKRGGLNQALVAGVLGGLAIFVAYVAAYAATDQLKRY